jgi:hypothetical protein
MRFLFPSWEDVVSSDVVSVGQRTWEGLEIHWRACWSTPFPFAWPSGQARVIMFTGCRGQRDGGARRTDSHPGRASDANAPG